MRHVRPLLLTTLMALTGPAVAAAQGSGCRWVEGTTNVNSRTVGQNRITYASTPRIRCTDGRYMQADSALQFEASGFSEFLGNVVFRDGGRTLRASHATYYENLGRLEADGSVVLVEADGNELRGERLLYLRTGPLRPVEQLTMAGGRPEAVLYPGQGNAPPADSVRPYLVEADRIFLQGEDIFQARGNVEVERDSLSTRSDSLYYDQTGGSLELIGTPAVLVRGELDLRGRRVRILLPGDVIEEVVAREEALLTTDSLEVTAPFIRLFLDEGELRRMVAAVPTESADSAGGSPPGPRRSPGADSATAEADSVRKATATTREIVMRADSLDVLAPGQRLQRMVAVGSARAVSTARDSLNLGATPELLRNDWIEGDTVVALFTGAPELEGDSAVATSLADSVVAGPDRPAAPPVEEAADSGEGEARLERLRATVRARSLYRLDPDSSQVRDTTAYRARLPATYAEARAIALTFRDGQVVHFVYDGLERGQQLQPVYLPGERPDSAAADTTAGSLDRSGLQVDTTASPPDTTASPPDTAPSPAGAAGARADPTALPAHTAAPRRSRAPRPEPTFRLDGTP